MTEWLEQKEALPKNAVVSGKPGTKNETASRFQDAIGFRKEPALVDHMLGALDRQRMIKTLGFKIVLEPVHQTNVNGSGVGPHNTARSYWADEIVRAVTFAE